MGRAWPDPHPVGEAEHPICALASAGEVELGRRPGGGKPWRLGVKAEVGEDPAHARSVGEERDELALAAAVGAAQGIDLEGTSFILRLPQRN